MKTSQKWKIYKIQIIVRYVEVIKNNFAFRAYYNRNLRYTVKLMRVYI